MGEITKITTHVADAKDRLLEQYRDSAALPNFHAILEIFAERFQGLENILENFNADRSIFTGIGIQLDRIGGIVGLNRVLGQSDTLYRDLLLIKIIQNNTYGTGENLIIVTKLLTGASIVQYVNLFNATVSLYLNVDINPTNDPDVSQFFNENIQKIVLGGVEIDGIISSVETDFFDLWNNVSTSELSDEHGLSSVSDTLIGGQISRIN